MHWRRFDRLLLKDNCWVKNVDIFHRNIFKMLQNRIFFQIFDQVNYNRSKSPTFRKSTIMTELTKITAFCIRLQWLFSPCSTIFFSLQLHHIDCIRSKCQQQCTIAYTERSFFTVNRSCVFIWKMECHKKKNYKWEIVQRVYDRPFSCGNKILHIFERIRRIRDKRTKVHTTISCQ